MSVSSDTPSVDSGVYQTEPDCGNVMWSHISAACLSVEHDAALLHWFSAGTYTSVNSQPHYFTYIVSSRIRAVTQDARFLPSLGSDGRADMNAKFADSALRQTMLASLRARNAAVDELQGYHVAIERVSRQVLLQCTAMWLSDMLSACT